MVKDNKHSGMEQQQELLPLNFADTEKPAAASKPAGAAIAGPVIPENNLKAAAETETAKASTGETSAVTEKVFKAEPSSGYVTSDKAVAAPKVKKCFPEMNTTVKNKNPEYKDGKKMSAKNKDKDRDKEKLVFGKVLQDARMAQGLSLAQVEQMTRIREEYIGAIETEDLKRLPPVVYVCAYVKTLCGIYKISPVEAEKIVGNLKKNLEIHLTEELFGNIKIDREINVEREEQVKRFLLGVGALTGVLIIVGAVVFFSFFSREGFSPAVKGTTAAAIMPESGKTAAVAAAPETETADIDQGRLKKLTPDQFITMTRITYKKAARPGR